MDLEQRLARARQLIKDRLQTTRFFLLASGYGSLAMGLITGLAAQEIPIKVIGLGDAICGVALLGAGHYLYWKNKNKKR